MSIRLGVCRLRWPIISRLWLLGVDSRIKIPEIELGLGIVEVQPSQIDLSLRGLLAVAAPEFLSRSSSEKTVFLARKGVEKLFLGLHLPGKASAFLRCCVCEGYLGALVEFSQSPFEASLASPPH